MTPGQFIVVEGLEGSGKSTAIKILELVLKERSVPFMKVREPGGTDLGEALRSLIVSAHEPFDPRAELLLFYAARVQLIEKVIKPALLQGTWVLADRFELSSFAYQGGGRGIHQSLLDVLSEYCVAETKPDLTIFMDISPELGLQRACSRGGGLDIIEQESLVFFNRVWKSYQQHLASTNHVIRIDASQPLISVEDALKQTLTDFLKRHENV